MERYACRKSEAILRVTDREGRPLANTPIHAVLRKHEFLFGTGAFFYEPATNPDRTPEQKAYSEKICAEWAKTFNYGTVPFYIGQYEPQRGKPREAETMRGVKRLAAEGKSVKGHPLCWHTISAPWMYDMTEKEAMDYFLYRIEREIGAFHDYIRYWDVINEVVIMPEFVNEPAFMPRMNPMTRVCRKLGRVQTVKTLFDKAHACDPSATLLLNDFNTSERYRQLIADCLNAGVKIDTIGIQSHQHQGFWGMEKLQEVTERFEQFGLPIHYTENTFVSGHEMPPEIVDLNDYVLDEWPGTPEGEERQKQNLMTMMEYLFDRPLVEGFTTWDFEDHQWLRAPSGLIRSDGSPKPALLALQEHLRTDWHTDAELMTDENGVCRLYGYRGEYEITAAGGTAGLKLSRDSGEITLTI